MWTFESDEDCLNGIASALKSRKWQQKISNKHKNSLTKKFGSNDFVQVIGKERNQCRLRVWIFLLPWPNPNAHSALKHDSSICAWNTGLPIPLTEIVEFRRDIGMNSHSVRFLVLFCCRIIRVFGKYQKMSWINESAWMRSGHSVVSQTT